MGDMEWGEGISINISESGVLFQTMRRPLPPETPLEMVITLPIERAGERPVRIECRGTVIRHAGSAEGYDTPVMAVALSHFRFARERIMGARASAKKT